MNCFYYSFLSPDENIQARDQFHQLIAKNLVGKFHALQISTARSIRTMQENSKAVYKTLRMMHQ